MEQSTTPFAILTLKENSPLKRSLKLFRKRRPSSTSSNTIPEIVKTPSQFKNNLQTPSKSIHEQEKVEDLSAKGSVEEQVRDSALTFLEGRTELKYPTNPRFFRLIDSAIEHFGYEGGQEKGIVDERKSESDFIDEGNGSISEEELMNKRQEINDIKKEIAQKNRIRLEQQRKILKLTFDINNLKAMAKDPMTVLH